MRFARLAVVLILPTALRAQCPAFSTPLYYATDVPAEPRAIVTANLASADAAVMLGNGDGTFVPAQRYQLEARPQSVAVADFNLDGKPDFAVIKAGSARISTFLGNGDGTFTPAPDAFTTFQPE